MTRIQEDQNLKYLWTASGSRLILVNSKPGKNLNWLFIPGGLGMGSEYFYPLTSKLDLPGNIWHVDLPNNGSNQSREEEYDYNLWLDELYHLGVLLPNTIMVGHSCGGMILLCQPKLQSCLKGLILLNSSPRDWIQAAEKKQRSLGLTGLEIVKHEYLANPNNENFRKVLLASIPYMCSRSSEHVLNKTLQTLPLDYRAFNWSFQFLHGFDAKLIPQMPTLIIGGEEDYMTPFELFKNDGRFRCDNINLVDLPKASHFVWLEQELNIINMFELFSKNILF